MVVIAEVALLDEVVVLVVVALSEELVVVVWKTFARIIKLLKMKTTYHFDFKNFRIGFHRITCHIN